MYACVFVGVFCMWVCQAQDLFEESHLWTLCDWKIQDGDLCNPRILLDFFIMCLSCVLIVLSLHMIFNCMYKGFLDLVWI